MDRLADRLAGPSQTLGAVAHSIRAAPPAEIAALHREAGERGLVLHLHVEEQRKEIVECVATYGATPMQILTDELEISSAVTAVHATHTRPEDMERFIAAGGNVCLCPLTEANLGDGVADLPKIHAQGGTLALGTDSNARISMLEEMRWLEYVQRLVRERRGVLAGGDGEVAASLLEAATAGGARALGLPAGTIAAGRWADFATVDLGAPVLEGWQDDTLAAAVVFGADEAVVAETAVGGAWSSER